MAEAVVLDASAVLADLNDEPGGDVVRALGGGGRISAVNFTEIITKLIDKGATADEARYAAETLDLHVIDADQTLATEAGMLHARTRGKGVSLGDRFCLALGRRSGLPVLTADRQWASLDVGVEVRLIR